MDIELQKYLNELGRLTDPLIGHFSEYQAIELMILANDQCIQEGSNLQNSELH